MKCIGLKIGVLILILVLTSTALSSREQITTDTDFGYGLSVTYPDGDYAKSMGFNWIKVYDPPVKVQPTNVLYRVELSANDANNLGTFATALNSFVATYGDFIDGYEIGNEPNLSSEWGAPPIAEDYVSILCTAYDTIKSGDPDAVVVSAGLATVGRIPNTWNGHKGHNGNEQDEREYLKEFLAHDGQNCSDAIGYHPMGFRADYDAEPDVDGGTDGTDCGDGFCFRSIEKIHEILQDAGLGHKKIWATEVGWIVPPPDGCLAHPSWSGRDWQIVSPTMQADNLVGAFEYGRLHWSWLGALFVFNLDFITVPTPYYAECEQMRYYSIMGTPAETALREMPKTIDRTYLPVQISMSGKIIISPLPVFPLARSR